MSRIHLPLIFLILIVSVTSVYAQRGNPIVPNSGSITISLETATGSPQNPFFSTVLSNNNDAVNGVSYNGGSAMSFKVHSDKPYNIRLAADNGTGSEVNSSMRYVDIRNFIFYRIIENTTGGFTQESGIYPEGECLGNTEHALISHCPATDAGFLRNDERLKYKTFSLVFKLKTGYSVPPGNYTTNLLITATYD